MAELIKIAEDKPIKYNTFSIYYRIKTADNTTARHYNSVVKYPAGQSRTKYENLDIHNTKKYCGYHDERVDTWVVHDKDNKMPKSFIRINPITSKIYSR